MRWVLALLALALALGVAAGDNAHTVTDLPGLEHEASFKHHAGQLQLEAGERLFYWYAESREQPETAPVVLWLNGGPGCSSLGGFFTENGPFVVTDDLTLTPNTYAWNRKVNLVWLESPAGVGFSGPLQDAAYYNDDTTAAKAHEFLASFFAKYTELQGRPLFITGESYAGVYIPYLVELLVQRPISGVNLAGFAIGNAYTDPPIDGNALFDYYVSHALISPAIHASIMAACDHELGWVYSGASHSQECEDAANAGFAAAGHGQFNIFYIYGDVCLVDNRQVEALHSSIGRANLAPSHRGDIGVCADVLTQTYLNQPSVQAALHVEGGYVDWSDCSDEVAGRYTPSASALPKYASILGQGLKAMIYNGDADSDVSFIGSLRWIGAQGLNLSVVEPWRPWFGPNKQLAGYVEQYDGLTFKTIKGAGHLVPAIRPLQALNMLECFVFGDEECASFSYPIDGDEVEAGLLAIQTLSAAVFSGSHSETVVFGIGAALVLLVAAVAVKNRSARAEYTSIPHLP